VRAIGLGTAPGMDFEHLGDCEKRETFCCFGGQPFQRIEATVSPENEASRRVLEKCDFHAAQSGLSASGPLLTISQSLAHNPESFHENFRSLYKKNREGVPPLEKGKSYAVQDSESVQHGIPPLQSSISVGN